MTRLALVFACCIAGITACKQESAPPPAPKAQPAPTPTPTPAPTTSDATAPVKVEMITLGKAIGPDKKVTVPTETFAKNDTIYASVDTTGNGTATLKARWTYLKGDKPTLVDESTQTINATGPATTEFHVSKPDGWPPGDYQVEILINDQPGGTRKFLAT